MHSILHILNTSTELMSAVELMSGAKSRKWVHQKPTNQPTNQITKVGAPETNQPNMPPEAHNMRRAADV